MNRCKIVPSNAVVVAAGGYHRLFIKSDGNLWAMDDNGQGQLGDGTPREQLSPGQKQEIDRVYRAYPHLNDDTFVAEHLDEWLQ